MDILKTLLCLGIVTIEHCAAQDDDDNENRRGSFIVATWYIWLVIFMVVSCCCGISGACLRKHYLNKRANASTFTTPQTPQQRQIRPAPPPPVETSNAPYPRQAPIAITTPIQPGVFGPSSPPSYYSCIQPYSTTQPGGTNLSGYLQAPPSYSEVCNETGK